MVTIGVIGAGKLAPRMIRSLLDDQLDAHEAKIELILPLSRKHFTDEVDIIVDWADKNDVAYDVVVDPTTKDDAVEDILETAGEIVETGKGEVPETIAELVAEKGGLLYVLWDDADDDGYAAFEKAYEAGVECYDMVNGLERLTFEDDLEEPEPEEEPTSEETDPEEDAAPAKPEGEGINTRAEMKRMKVGPLKEMMAKRGITLNREGKGRITKGAYVDAILIHDETGATEFMQAGDSAVPVEDGYDAEAAEYEADPEAEAVAGMIDADEPEVPADEAEVAEEVQAEPEATTAPPTTTKGNSSNVTYSSAYWAPAQPAPVGNCAGCAGPVYAHFDRDASPWPEVRWFHAKNCSLA